MGLLGGIDELFHSRVSVCAKILLGGLAHERCWKFLAKKP
jgi:hypothetical protein